MKASGASKLPGTQAVCEAALDTDQLDRRIRIFPMDVSYGRFVAHPVPHVPSLITDVEFLLSAFFLVEHGHGLLRT